ncbi:MAG: alpha/beta fold hydrolase [Dehalococcoidia bacterium]
MPFVTAEDGVRIHYELEGPEDGVPLVLMHGLTSSMERWRLGGYPERLRDRYRLILVDGRGHGESDLPTRPEDYDYRTRVLDLVSVIRDAGHDSAHLWGYSMGGQLTMSAAIYAPQRFRSFTIGGASPYGAKDSAITVPWEQFWEQVKENPGADTHRESWRAAFVASRTFGGAIQALRATKVPTLIYAGSNDAGPHRGLTEYVSAYGARHFTLPDKDHRTANLESAAEVVPRVTAFIDEVEAAAK